MKSKVDSRALDAQSLEDSLDEVIAKYASSGNPDILEKAISQHQKKSILKMPPDFFKVPRDLSQTTKGEAELNRAIIGLLDQTPIQSSFQPHFMLILKQVAICSSSYFSAKHRKLIAKGFTHVVAISDVVPKN